MKKFFIILLLCLVYIGYQAGYRIDNISLAILGEEIEDYPVQLIIGQHQIINSENIEFSSDLEVDKVLSDLTQIPTDQLGLQAETIEVLCSDGSKEELQMGLWVLDNISQEDLLYVQNQVTTYLSTFEEDPLEISYKGWLDQEEINSLIDETMESGSYMSALIYRVDHQLNFNYDSTGNVESELKLTRINHHNADQEAQVEAYVEATIQELGLDSPDLSDYDRVERIHDHIIYNAAYALPEDPGYRPMTKSDNLDRIYGVSVHSPYAITQHGRGVCQSYAALFQKFSDRLDIPSRFILGTRDYHGEEKHSWNKVQIDGNWYNIDLTWDDPVIGNGSNNLNTGYERKQYFLRSDEVFLKDHSFETNLDIPAYSDYFQ